MDRIAREMESQRQPRGRPSSRVGPALGRGGACRITARRRAGRCGRRTPSRWRYARRRRCCRRRSSSASPAADSPPARWPPAGPRCRSSPARRSRRPSASSALVWGVTPALTEHSTNYDTMLAGARHQILERGLAAAGRAAGGHGGRAVRHARHYQPPQDRSSLGHAAHVPGHRHVVRRAPDRLRLRGLPLDRPARQADPLGRVLEAGGPRILIDTPPELRLQLMPAGSPGSMPWCTPTSMPIT